MGQKIKPMFSSDFHPPSEGWKLFRIKEANAESVKPEDQKEKDGITNDKNFIVRVVVEGGEDDGIESLITFQNRSKREFGLSLLYGLMVKTEAISSSDEIDVETMRTDKFESKFKMSLPKRLFGGRVRHAKGEGDKIYGNVVEFLTVSEYKEKTAGKESGKGNGRPEKESTPQKGRGEPKEGEKDHWAEK